MVALTFDAVSKSYGDTAVIREFSAHVAEGEFLALLGPSGCGKSTVLRMIAGLIDVTSGRILFDDAEVNQLTPKQRGVAFVFQSYALYPHMTVRENIAIPLVMHELRWWWHFPFANSVLRRRLAKRQDIAEQVEQTAAMLELTDYLDRRPRALSGGQRQRVAVARSIARRPSVYLLDEPLSNLDAKLRMQMRAEISALHARVKRTFVYATHDQIEAMTMGTKVILLSDGVVQQDGTPSEIYDTPANVFVARFIGAPPMNIFSARCQDSRLIVDGEPAGGAEPLVARLTAAGLSEVTLGVRAEKASIGVERPVGAISVAAHATVTEHLGAETIVGVKFGAPGAATQVGAAASRSLHYVRVLGEAPVAAEQPCFLSFGVEDVHVFDPADERRLEV